MIRVIRIGPLGRSVEKNHHLLVNNHTFLLAMSPKRSIFVGIKRTTRLITFLNFKLFLLWQKFMEP